MATQPRGPAASPCGESRPAPPQRVLTQVTSLRPQAWPFRGQGHRCLETMPHSRPPPGHGPGHRLAQPPCGGSRPRAPGIQSTSLGNGARLPASVTQCRPLSTPKPGSEASQILRLPASCPLPSPSAHCPQTLPEASLWSLGPSSHSCPSQGRPGRLGPQGHLPRPHAPSST